ncbi:anillin-like [Sitophilus oryzae]|uniref:Anillin-like n=1 Tax=Sitophilus oryzae TaxID=7048 RepID=A0A6J2YBE8_SITOR|nr:anillin-like [Sitophilus oryzae]
MRKMSTYIEKLTSSPNPKTKAFLEKLAEIAFAGIDICVLEAPNESTMDMQRCCEDEESCEDIPDMKEECNLTRTETFTVANSSETTPPLSRNETFFAKIIDILSLTESDYDYDSLFPSRRLHEVESYQASSPRVIKPIRKESIEKNPFQHVLPPVNTDFYIPKKVVSYESKKVADVVHDLVFEKYEQRYNTLLRKLRKTHFTKADKKFINVIEEMKRSFATNSNEDVPELFSEESDNDVEYQGYDSDEGYAGYNEMNKTSDPTEHFVTALETLSIQVKSKDDAIGITSQSQPQNNNINGNRISCVSSIMAENEAKVSAYDERKFLSMAIGDELKRGSTEDYVYPRTASVNSNEISELVSSTSSTMKLSEMNPTEFLKHTLQSSESLFNLIENNSCVSYECLTNLSEEAFFDSARKNLKKRVYIEENIANQLLGFLEFGRSNIDKFIGSNAHLEAERLLTVSNIRRQAILDLMISPYSPTHHVRAQITIQNARCIINDEDLNDYTMVSNYLLVLSYRDRIYSTKPISPNKLGWIDLGGPFVFNSVPNTFEIKAELFAIKCNSHSPKISFKNIFFGRIPKLPMIRLVGETYINLSNASNQKFTFKNIIKSKYRPNRLTASVEIGIQWPEPLKAFLSMGSERPGKQVLWNRRWFVLEKSKLSYYTHPSDENYCSPRAMLDLTECLFCDEVNKLYPNKRSLVLVLGCEKQKKIYVTPDTSDELKLWQERIHLVLKSLKYWNIEKF